MNRNVIIFLILILSNLGIGQKADVSSKQLTKQDVVSVFTDSLRSKLQIEYSIYRVYEYNDRTGKHFIVMTENKIDCKEREKCFNAIKAYCFLLKNETYNLEWTLNDFILPNGNEVSEEFSISFWTKYFKLDDYDGNGMVDPILVYGTFGTNGTDDGRIKILVYYNGKKIAIRHQNGTLDFERNTTVDAKFYELPIQIQNRVKFIMKNITGNNHGIFPYGWQKAMANKKLKFDEN